METWRIQGLVARFRKVRFKLVYIKEDELKRTSKRRKKGSEENCGRKPKKRKRNKAREDQKYLENSVVERKLD